MAWERAVLDLPAGIAGSSFASGNGYQSTGQFLFVRLHTENPDVAGTANTFVPCTSVSDDPVGVSQNNPASGGSLQVRVEGVTKIVAGGTIRVGDSVGTDANGKAVTKAESSTGANYGNFVRGVALEGGAAGELVTVLLSKYYRIH